jgi:hypothetical protein
LSRTFVREGSRCKYRTTCVSSLASSANTHLLADDQPEHSHLLYSDDPYNQSGNSYGTYGQGTQGLLPQHTMSPEELKREQEALESITRWTGEWVGPLTTHICTDSRLLATSLTSSRTSSRSKLILQTVTMAMAMVRRPTRPSYHRSLATSLPSQYASSLSPDLALKPLARRPGADYRAQN